MRLQKLTRGYLGTSTLNGYAGCIKTLMLALGMSRWYFWFIMFEHGELDTRQTQLPEHLERTTIAEMPPGSVWGVLPGCIWVDEDRNVWVNTGYPIKVESELGDEYASSVARLIRFEEGFVLDLSGYEDTDLLMPHFQPQDQEAYSSDADYAGEFLPIIHIATTKEACKPIRKLFKDRYGKKLNGMPLATKQNLTPSQRTSVKISKPV